MVYKLSTLKCFRMLTFPHMQTTPWNKVRRVPNPLDDTKKATDTQLLIAEYPTKRKSYP